MHFQVDSAINRGSSDALDVTASGSGVYDFEFAAGDLRADHVLLRTRPATLFNRSNLNNIPGLQNAKERLVDYHYSTAESLNGSGSQAYDSDYSSTVTGSVTLEHTLNLTEPEHMHAVAKFELDGNGLTFTPYNWSPANRSVVFNFGGITHGLTSTATPSGGVPNLPGAYDGPGNFSGAFLAGSLPLLDVYVYGGSNYSPALCMEGYGTEQTVSFDYDVPGYTPLDTTQFVSGTAPYDQPNPIRCNGINGFDTLNFQAYLSHPFTVPEANPADEPIATVNPVTLLSQVCGFSVSALSPDLKLYYKALSLSPYWTGSVFQPFELEEWSSRGNLFTPILNNPLASSELERLAAPIFVGPIPGATA